MNYDTFMYYVNLSSGSAGGFSAELFHEFSGACSWCNLLHTFRTAASGLVELKNFTQKNYESLWKSCSL